MHKILLTGFEPFLNFDSNPTMKVVQTFNEQVISGFEIHSKTLVVDFHQSAEQFKKYIEEIQPAIIISLGLAGGRTKVTPERVAINIKDGATDNNGYTPMDEELYPGEAAAYFSTLPIRAIVNELNAQGLPAEISNSAGTYLCNNIMYEAMRYASEQKEVLAGFIHIPADFELAIAHGKVPGWHIRDLIESIRIVIEQVILAFNEKKPS